MYLKFLLKIGDEIHYWTTAHRYGQGYHQHNGLFKVSKYDNAPDNLPDITTISSKIDIPVSPTEDPETCKKSLTTVKGVTQCEGALIFEENFINFDQSKWGKEIKIPIDTEVNLYEC